MATRIFHFSDFHINPDCGHPNNNKLFNAICQHLNQVYKPEPGDSSFIVYTGDIIDADRKSDETDEQYRNKIDASYSLANTYFEKLMSILEVGSERIVFCPGNHDKTRINDIVNNDLCSNEVRKSGRIALDGLNPNYNLYSVAYQKYIDFTQMMCGRNQDFKTSFYSKDKFNFLIMNSTWKEKDAEYQKNDSKNTKAYRRCVDCKGVVDVLAEHTEDISNDEYRNIVLVHDPLFNWCENSLLHYDKTVRKYIYNALKHKFKFILSGDIHTISNIDGAYTISTKLPEQTTASYGCIEYGSNNPIYRTYLANSSGSVSLIVNNTEREKIYKLSTLSENTYYIKKLALKFLYGTDKEVNDTSISQTIDDFSIENSRWSKLSELFELITNYREKDDSGKTIRIQPDQNIFASIAEDIQICEGNIRLSVKSRPSQGKSTFLSLLYIYFLELFLSGNFPFIPVYFNRECLTETKYEEKKRIFKEFTSRANDLAIALKCPVCFILDGFNQYNYFGHSFDNYVYEQYLEKENLGLFPGCNCILSIDTDKNRNKEPTHIGELKTAPHILYFNDIETTGLKEDTTKAFLKLLTEMLHTKNSKKIISQILKSGIGYVDMNLIVRHGEAFVDNSDLAVIFSSYGRNADIFPDDMINSMPECSYNILYLSSRFDLLPKKLKVTHSIYCALLRQREVGMYYCAQYYFIELRRLASKKKKEKIGKDSVLNRFFSHEQNVYLKICRDKFKITAQELDVFLKYHFNDLQYLGKAQFLYLFVKTTNSSGELIINNTHFKLTKTPAKLEAKDKFRAELLNRTKIVIKAFDNSNAMKDYIHSLLKNREKRMVNRAAHMFYYSDVNFTNATRIYTDDTVFIGFDIYHTFGTLTSRIKKTKGDENLKLLDLITLCDLIENRFRQPVAKQYDSDECSDSFFYNENYFSSVDVSPKIILEEFISTIDSFDLSTINDSTISVYIKKCRQDAEIVLGLFDAGKKCITSELFNRANAYELVKRIETEERKGWKINAVLNNGTAPEKYKDYSKGPSLETVEQHIYQSFLMGLLYLPVDYPDKNELKKYNGKYDKQKILNTLLIHDLGESETGDWPDYYSCYKEKKEKEDRFNKNLYIGGAYSETSDLTDYLELWNNWNEGINDDINAVIAKELDRIQFLYRYYELKKAGELKGFSRARDKQILKERGLINTVVGKNILRILIDDNPYIK